MMGQIFEMKLRRDPFERICSGEKKVEYRLHDEKRSQLKSGDLIRFTEMSDEKNKVLVEVVDIFTASCFDSLEQLLIEKGIICEGSFSPSKMREYYSAEDEEKYGVMGINIKVIERN